MTAGGWPGGGSPFDALKGSFERLTDFRVARASHILIKAFDDEAVAEMVAWKDEIGTSEERFAELARTKSQCPSRIRGGDLGFFTRGKMVKEFDTVVFTQEPGSVYGPIKTNFGNHLIFLHSCRKPQG